MNEFTDLCCLQTLLEVTGDEFAFLWCRCVGVPTVHECWVLRRACAIGSAALPHIDNHAEHAGHSTLLPHTCERNISLAGGKHIGLAGGKA